jgi:hypothetical protein
MSSGLLVSADLSPHFPGASQLYLATGEAQAETASSGVSCVCSAVELSDDMQREETFELQLMRIFLF